MPVLKVLPVFEVKGLRFVPMGPGVLGALTKLMKEHLELGIEDCSYLVASRPVAGGDA